MATQPLTLQAFINQHWQDIAIIEFDDGKQIQSFVYLQEYSFEHFLADNHFATSINYPVEVVTYPVVYEGHWLPFLDDIIPAGASRRYWMQRLDLSRLSKAEQDYELLKSHHCTCWTFTH